MENVRCFHADCQPLGPALSPPPRVSYNVIFRFDPVTLHLVPETIRSRSGTGASACACTILQVRDNSGARRLGPFSGATVDIGSRYHQFVGRGLVHQPAYGRSLHPALAASGYVTTRAAACRAPRTNNVAVALSPATRADR